MHPGYDAYYQQMRRQLEARRRGGGDPLFKLLVATAIAEGHLRALPLEGIVVDQRTYYKDHWPVFEAERQYYELSYEAERCRPSGAPEVVKQFWVLEADRLFRQIRAHRDLYAYYTRGGTDRDERYFGGDPVVARQNAVLWASFMALSRYKREVLRICAGLV